MGNVNQCLACLSQLKFFGCEGATLTTLKGRSSHGELPVDGSTNTSVCVSVSVDEILRQVQSNITYRDRMIPWQDDTEHDHDHDHDGCEGEFLLS